MRAITFTAGDYAATIDSHGGGLSALSFRGHPLIHGYDATGEAPAPMTSGAFLAPWPNRVADGSYRFAGVEYVLEITEPERNNAIHGLVANQIWEVTHSAPSAATLRLDSEAHPGWPWPMRYEVTWELDAATGLSAAFAARNEGHTPCPYGFGWHPYLNAQGAALDECTLRLPVVTTLPLDPVRNLPAGPEVPASSIVPAAGAGQPMGGLWLDHCFRLEEQRGDSASQSVVQLCDADGIGTELWAEASLGWLQVFTADPSRQQAYPGVGRAVAVEPMSCPPNALQTGVDVQKLGPGEAVVQRFGLRAVGRR